MNVIQIQDLINKIGEFNKNSDLKEYYEDGEEILESQLKIIEDSHTELNHKLLIQLKEKSDVELLQKFINLIDENGADLHILYNKYRIKLAESKKPNKSNPIYSKSVPIVCKLIDSKLDVLTNLKQDLITKIANFDYIISTDFDYNTFSESNQKQEKETAGRATFNLSKKEAIMLVYILEKTDLLKFESEEQIPKFIEKNFCFTEIRDNADKGKSIHMKDVRSEISKLRGGQHSESNNKILEKLLNKLNETIHLFEF